MTFHATQARLSALPFVPSSDCVTSSSHLRSSDSGSFPPPSSVSTTRIRGSGPGRTHGLALLFSGRRDSSSVYLPQSLRSICLSGKATPLLPRLPSAQHEVQILIQGQVPNLPLSALTFNTPLPELATPTAGIPQQPWASCLCAICGSGPHSAVSSPVCARIAALLLCVRPLLHPESGLSGTPTPPPHWAQFLCACAWLSVRVKLPLPSEVLALDHL